MHVEQVLEERSRVLRELCCKSILAFVAGVGVPAGPRDAVHFAGVGITKAISASEGDDWRATAEPTLPRRYIQGKSPLVFRHCGRSREF